MADAIPFLPRLGLNDMNADGELLKITLAPGSCVEADFYNFAPAQLRTKLPVLTHPCAG